ncbi:MAG: M50 family metallopeptidase [Candidatus Spechtbacterales bacterium]
MKLRVFGTEIYLGLGAVFLLAIFALFGFNFLGDVLSVIIFSILAFLCLFIHEFSHVLAGRMFGIPCRRITVWFFGMGAHLVSMGKSPKEAFLIGVAGPLTSFALAAFFLLVLASGLPIPFALANILSVLVLLNIVLGIFNILPLFPTDGGRVAHSVFWFFTKDRVKGIYLAVYLSKILIVVAMLYLVANAILYGMGFFSLLWYGFIAWFLWSAGTAELRMAKAGMPPYN